MAENEEDGPDVELKDMGLIEVRFLTRKSREWAYQHRIPNEMEDESRNYLHQEAWHPGQQKGVYSCRVSRREAEVLENMVKYSGMSVNMDPRMSPCEKMRFINCY